MHITHVGIVLFLMLLSQTYTYVLITYVLIEQQGLLCLARLLLACVYGVCSVQCAVCSVQCAVCNVQCAVCSVQCAVCTLHRSFIANIEVTLMISCSAMQYIPRRCPFGALHHCYLMLHQVAALWWSTTSNASKAGAHKQAPSFTSSQHHTAHQIPINRGVALPFLFKMDVCNVWMRGFQVLCCDVFSFPQFQWKPDF